MIEIENGSIDAQIIKILQKTYPVTIEDIENKLHLSHPRVLRVLNQLHVKGIVLLEPLPDKIYVRLLRSDFKFVGKKRQRKFVKHHRSHQPFKAKSDDDDDIMYR
jgi:Mn-dependent DtxR family transcriptional regulator